MAQQILRNTGAVLTIDFSAGDADGTVTVSIVSDGGTVIASGSAIPEGSGVYSYVLAPQATLARATVAWTGAWSGVTETITTDLEIVGGQLFTVAEARAYRDQQLADVVAYPDDMIRQARERIADDFQNICGIPFFPRYERAVIDGGRSTTAWLPYKHPLRLITLSIDGTAITGGDLALVTVEETGRMYRAAGWGGTAGIGGYQNVVVEWERGFSVTPEPIKRAALALAHYELISSEITDRMVSFANELGTVRLSTPGKWTPTGIPLVDATLMRYDKRDTVLTAVR